MEKDDNVFLFYEVFNYFRQRGHIVVSTYNKEKKSLINTKIIMKKKHHISYPQVIEFDGVYYLIPETHEIKTISLYKFTKFPYNLKHEKDLFSNFDCVDSTIFINNNKFYLFTNPLKNNKAGYYHGDIKIFYSQSILGPYKEIVKVGIDKFNSSNLRMAGNIIIKNNSAYRISQNCSKIYGENMNINRIISINKYEYVEKHIGKLEIGLRGPHHTYNESANYVVTDLVKFSSLVFILFSLIYITPIRIFKKSLKIIKTLINKVF